MFEIKRDLFDWRGICWLVGYREASETNIWDTVGDDDDAFFFSDNHKIKSCVAP